LWGRVGIEGKKTAGEDGKGDEDTSISFFLKQASTMVRI